MSESSSKCSAIVSQPPISISAPALAVLDLNVIVACTNYITNSCIASQGKAQCLTDATTAVMQAKALAAAASSSSSQSTTSRLLEILLPSLLGGEFACCYRVQTLSCVILFHCSELDYGSTALTKTLHSGAECQSPETFDVGLIYKEVESIRNRCCTAASL